MAVCVATTATVASGQTPREVRMPHYSFVVPAAWAGWAVERQGGAFERVTLSTRTSGRPSLFYNVLIMRQTVLDPALRAMTAKDVADDYRKREENGMRTEGVAKGLYELRDLASADEALDGRTAYVMRYVSETSHACSKAALYLLFPKESHSTWFIIAHHSVTAPRESSSVCSWGAADTVAAEFVEALGGLQFAAQPQETEGEVARLTALAQEGNADAQFDLGAMYDLGRGGSRGQRSGSPLVPPSRWARQRERPG